MTPTDVLHEAERLGLSLKAEGERLFIVPGSKAPAEFVEAVREHKAEIMRLLAAGEGEERRPFAPAPQQIAESAGRWLGLPRSVRPWLPIWPDAPGV